MVHRFNQCADQPAAWRSKYIYENLVFDCTIRSRNLDPRDAGDWPRNVLHAANIRSSAYDWQIQSRNWELSKCECPRNVSYCQFICSFSNKLVKVNSLGLGHLDYGRYFWYRIHGRNVFYDHRYTFSVRVE